MPPVKAQSINQANEMLHSGKYQEVELNFEIDADTFFELTDEIADSGARITRRDNHFVIKLPQEPLTAS